jgi:hypothetical protein
MYSSKGGYQLIHSHSYSQKGELHGDYQFKITGGFPRHRGYTVLVCNTKSSGAHHQRLPTL